MITAGLMCAALFCFTGGVIAWPIGVWLGWRSVARVPRGHCGACGYDRSGVDDAEVCPECGTGRVDAMRNPPPGAERRALVHVVSVLVPMIATFVLTLGATSAMVTLIGVIIAALCFTAACVWFLIPFIKGLSRRSRRPFIAGASVAYLGMLLLIGGVSVRMLDVAGFGELVVAALLVHALALSFVGWVVLFSASFAAGERVAGPLED